VQRAAQRGVPALCGMAPPVPAPLLLPRRRYRAPLMPTPTASSVASGPLMICTRSAKGTPPPNVSPGQPLGTEWSYSEGAYEIRDRGKYQKDSPEDPQV
jgi:hypothetical protein